MFIGHVPAGYLATRLLLGRVGLQGRPARHLVGLGMAASVAPDLDLLWFYFVDDQQHVHHSFLPHLPSAWALALGGLLAAAWVAGRSGALLVPVLVVGSNAAIHLTLDTVAGGIRWLWPVSDHEFALVSVPARFSPWYLNFVLHWTFALELVLVGVAAFTAMKHGARVVDADVKTTGE